MRNDAMLNILMSSSSDEEECKIWYAESPSTCGEEDDEDRSPVGFQNSIFCQDELKEQQTEEKPGKGKRVSRPKRPNFFKRNEFGKILDFNRFSSDNHRESGEI